MERKPEVKDADAEVTPPRDEEADQDLDTVEEAPEDIAADRSRNPFMEREEETLPPDFPTLL